MQDEHTFFRLEAAVQLPDGTGKWRIEKVLHDERIVAVNRERESKTNLIDFLIRVLRFLRSSCLILPLIFKSLVMAIR